MRRGPKPAKSKAAKPPVAHKSPRSEGAKVRDLENRLAEALKLQALLQVANPGALVLGRVAGNRGLGFLGLRGLWTPTHEPPLASFKWAGDTLGEPVSQGKGTANRNLSLPGGCVRGG